MAKLKILSSKPISNKESAQIRAAIKINQKFFQFEIPNLQIEICHNAAEWKKASRYYYFPHANGLVLLNGKVVVKSQKFSKKSLLQWKKILVHEFNHSFWIYLRKEVYKVKYNPWNPIWFIEGLACMVAKNDIILSKQEFNKLRVKRAHDLRLHYRYQAKLINTREDITFYYSYWYYTVKELVKNLEVDFLKLIRSIAGAKGKSEYLGIIKKLSYDSNVAQ